MILIIGGGISGLSVAASLKGEDVVLVEAEDKLGGYCTTTKRNGFVWDKAGHFFHFRNNAVKEYFDRKMKDKDFSIVQKNTAIYFDEYKYIDFPFQKNIHQLPKDIYIKCLIDLHKAQVDTDGVDVSFKDFVYSQTGKTIAELFLIPYNEKLYACNLDTLDKDAMGRFFPKVCFDDVLYNAVESSNTSYNATFSYPRDGAESFIDVVEKESNGKIDISLNTKIVSIDLDNKYATTSAGNKIEYDVLISTMPLDHLIKISLGKDEPSLTANKVCVFNLGFDTKPKDDKHWIYFPGNEVFYRVGAYHNIFDDNRASYYVEIGCTSDQEINEEHLLEQVLKDLAKVGLITPEMNLLDHEFFVMNPAYVHVNEKSELLKADRKELLSEYDVYSIGRYGDWKYCSIEDNIIEALELARDLELKYNFNTNLFIGDYDG